MPERDRWAERRLDQLPWDFAFWVQRELIRSQEPIHKTLQITKLTLIASSGQTLRRHTTIPQVLVLPAEFQIVSSTNPVGALLELIDVLGSYKGVSRRWQRERAGAIADGMAIERE